MGAVKRYQQEQTGIRDMKKIKHQPLPMKLRMLPSSFWQQPNTAGEILESAYIEPLEMSKTPTQSLVIGAPNTDLLFSLFKGLPLMDETRPITRKSARRGRPRKSTQKSIVSEIDEDPYVTSVAVPEVKIQKEARPVAEGINVPQTLKSMQAENSLHNTLSQLLQELAVNL